MSSQARAHGSVSVRRVWRAVSMCGTAVVLLVIAVAGVVTAPSVGAVAVGGSTPFGLTPSPLPDGRSRPYFDLSVAAGQSTVQTVVITNQGTTSSALKVSPSTGITAPNSGSVFYRYFKPCAGTGCWITGLPPVFTLAAHSSQSVSFTVTVPSGTPPKQYLAGITAEPEEEPSRVTVGSNGSASAQAIIIHQISVGVAVTVGSQSQLAWSLQIPKVTSGAAGPTPRLFIHVRNTGQMFTKSRGVTTCKDHGKETTYPVVSDTVLPGEGAILVTNAPGPCVRLVGHLYGPAVVRVRFDGHLVRNGDSSHQHPDHDHPHRTGYVHDTAGGRHPGLGNRAVRPWCVDRRGLGRDHRVAGPAPRRGTCGGRRVGRQANLTRRSIRGPRSPGS